MSTQETAWQAGESAASALGPEADLLASADAAGLGASTLAVLRRAARKPGATGTAALRYHGGGLLLHHRDLKNA